MRSKNYPREDSSLSSEQGFARTACNRESLIQLVCGESLSSQISSMVAQPSAVLN
jgi:hypothetical protein